MIMRNPLIDKKLNYPKVALVFKPCTVANVKSTVPAKVIGASSGL